MVSVVVITGSESVGAMESDMVPKVSAAFTDIGRHAMPSALLFVLRGDNIGEVSNLICGVFLVIGWDGCCRVNHGSITRVSCHPRDTSV